MEDIMNRKRVSETWTRNPMESKIVSKTSREYRIPERPVLKCHKCGRNSHLDNTCTKKNIVNEFQVIEEVQFPEEKEESDQDSVISENRPEEDYPIEKVKYFFEFTQVHSHFPQYSEH
ncbi:hypothetical protein O181_002644 [Austropuccinia psidii MF-1]|uniref:Uncharacterized protein n=1 Tax=Austropuccinia psidii MF-1 TaxID=1389203 RepID=A0A9Q3BCN0_9BASI|nr:hypothetical protein [Austropuccinia psidii MF-1]